MLVLAAGWVGLRSQICPEFHRKEHEEEYSFHEDEVRLKDF